MPFERTRIFTTPPSSRHVTQRCRLHVHSLAECQHARASDTAARSASERAASDERAAWSVRRQKASATNCAAHPAAVPSGHAMLSAVQDASAVARGSGGSWYEPVPSSLAHVLANSSATRSQSGSSCPSASAPRGPPAIATAAAAHSSARRRAPGMAASRSRRHAGWLEGHARESVSSVALSMMICLAVDRRNVGRRATCAGARAAATDGDRVRRRDLAGRSAAPRSN